MRQIINITQARNNFSQLISQVTKTNESVIILRDSEPAAVVISYEDFTQLQKEKETMWKLRFNNLMAEGKKAFNIYLKDKNIKLDSLTEEEAYEIIKKA